MFIHYQQAVSSHLFVLHPIVWVGQGLLLKQVCTLFQGLQER